MMRQNEKPQSNGTITMQVAPGYGPAATISVSRDLLDHPFETVVREALSQTPADQHDPAHHLLEGMLNRRESGPLSVENNGNYYNGDDATRRVLEVVEQGETSSQETAQRVVRFKRGYSGGSGAGDRVQCPSRVC